MAPIHHHFEQIGWAKSKVITRFWIVGIILALISIDDFETEIIAIYCNYAKSLKNQNLDGVFFTSQWSSLLRWKNCLGVM